MLKFAKSASVLTHKRALEFCDEKTRTFGEVVRHICVENAEGDHILWATCTAPLVFPSIYEKAIRRYFQALDEGCYDSLMSVRVFAGISGTRTAR